MGRPPFADVGGGASEIVGQEAALAVSPLKFPLSPADRFPHRGGGGDQIVSSQRSADDSIFPICRGLRLRPPGDPAPFAVGMLDFVFLSVFPVGAFRLEGVALLQRDVRCLVAIGFSGPRRLSKSRFRSSADRVSSVVRRHGSRHLRSVGGGMDASCRLGALPCSVFLFFRLAPHLYAGRERAALQGSCWDMKGPAFTGKPGRPLLSFLGKQERDFFLRIKDRQHSLSVLFKDVQSPHLFHLLPSPLFDFLKILPKLLSAEGRPDF